MAIPQVRGGELVIETDWQGLVADQIADYMDQVGEFAAQTARGLVPRETGATRRSVDHVVDPDDQSLYVFADYWDAGFSEFGAGVRGAATHGTAGASEWPGGSPMTYSGVPGRAATPFIRPAALAAVRRFFT